MTRDVCKAFRKMLAGREVVVAPGAFDAFSARLIEKAGFTAVYVGGSNINAVMGYPDGEATRTEYLGRVDEIVQAVALPVIIDIETGFGSGTALDLIRTVQICERIGVAGVHCEDQVTATKTQLTVTRGEGRSGAEVIPRDEMLRKIEAALEARADADFVFIARTDARARYGLDEALERGRAYAQAGADMVVVQALESVAELEQAVSYVGAPVLVFNGRTRPGYVERDPLSLSVSELQRIGVRMVTFGTPVLRTAGRAIQDLLGEIARTGTDRGFFDRQMTKEEVYELTGTAARDALRRRLLGS